jgi:hypothetical protein
MAGLSQAIQQILTKLDNIEVKQKSIVDMFLDNFDHDFKPFDKEIEYVFDYNTKKITKGTILLDNHLLVRKVAYWIYVLYLEKDTEINCKEALWNPHFFQKNKNNLVHWLSNTWNEQFVYYIDNYCNIYIEKLKLYIKINNKQLPLIPHIINKNLLIPTSHTNHWDIFLNPFNEGNLKDIISLIYFKLQFIEKRNLQIGHFNSHDKIIREKLDFNKYKDKTINDSEYVSEMVEFLLCFINYGEKIKVFHKLSKS